MRESNAVKDWTVAKERAVDRHGRIAASAGTVVFGLLTGIVTDLESTYDAVVRTKAEGREILRGPLLNAWFAEELRYDLRRMTKSAFVTKWNGPSSTWPSILS